MQIATKTRRPEMPRGLIDEDAFWICLHCNAKLDRQTEQWYFLRVPWPMTPPRVLATSCVSTTSCSHSPARMELTGMTLKRFSFPSGDNYSIRPSVCPQCYIHLRWHFWYLSIPSIAIHLIHHPSTELLPSILRFATSLNLSAALVTAVLLLLVPPHPLPGNGNPVSKGIGSINDFHVIKQPYGSFKSDLNRIKFLSILSLSLPWHFFCCYKQTFSDQDFQTNDQQACFSVYGCQRGPGSTNSEDNQITSNRGK